MMKKAILLYLTIVFPLFAANDICTRSQSLNDGVRVSSGQFKTGICFISITPTYIKNMTYRSFLATDKGQLMVFNSFGYGPGSTSTGARVFHFFPYSSKLSWSFESNFMELKLTNGSIATFDYENAILQNITDYDTSVDEDVVKDNNGGVELKPFKGIVLDSHFKMGGSPVWNLKRESTFIDSLGNTCKVKNSQIFEKKDDEVFLIYDDNLSLKKFLSQKCKNIVF